MSQLNFKWNSVKTESSALHLECLEPLNKFSMLHNPVYSTGHDRESYMSTVILQGSYEYIFL